MAVQIQLRRGTEAEWTSGNPTLAEGELGVELDTGKFKVGNGSDNWATLEYNVGPAGADGADGTNGVGVPEGGTEGQVLAKASGDDYDTEWVDQTGGATTDALLLDQTTPQEVENGMPVFNGLVIKAGERIYFDG